MDQQANPKLAALQQLLSGSQGQQLPDELQPADQPKKPRRKRGARPNLPRKPIPQRPVRGRGW